MAENIWIPVPFGHIAGRWYGNQKVRPILALHGWLDNLGSWETLIPLLPQHVGILCIDFPGHGRSSKYPPGILYHTFNHIELITLIMQTYNWEKVSLLGHSMGALVAFIYTGLYPHKVDLFISIDLVINLQVPVDKQIDILRNNIEKIFVEEERNHSYAFKEPPTYTFEELEQILHNGSKKSVNLDQCKHLLNRNIQRSKMFPEKYYFSRDGKLKFNMKFLLTTEFGESLGRRIKNVPYLIVRGKRSSFVNLKEVENFLSILRENNPYFEFHEIDDYHHVHLNKPGEVATILNPFILRHRPVKENEFIGRTEITEPRKIANKNKEIIVSKL